MTDNLAKLPTTHNPQPTTYLVVGLGNPGEEYANNRHTIGFMIVERLQVIGDRFSEWEEDKYAQTEVSVGKMDDSQVLLVKPTMFMNRSGQAVAYAVKKHKLKLEYVVVVHDDVDLPFGTLKISFGRGSGGHKGVESIIRALGTKDFVRVRVGVVPTTPIGKLKKPRGEKKVRDFLLSNFTPKEQKALGTIKEKAASAVATIITDGIQRGVRIQIVNA